MLPGEIKYAIRDLDCNKICGVAVDGIYAEYPKYGNDHILHLLSMCLIGILVREILPCAMIYVILLQN